MATQTTNLKLTKPELTDTITPTIFATNFDLIDSFAGKTNSVVNATLPVDGWVGDAAPYTNTVSVTGMLASHNPDVDLSPSSTYDTAQQQIKDYGYIYRITTAEGAITAYATDKPTVDLPIRFKGVI